MKVFVVSEIFYPDDTSTGYYLTEIAKHLAKDWDVNVICAYPFGLSASVGTKSLGLRILRTGKMHRPGSGLVRRGIGAALRVTRFMLLVARHCTQGDIIVVVTNPPLLPIAMRVVSSLRRLRLIVLIHDVYPQAAVVAGVLTHKSYLERSFLAVQQWVFRGCDRIICIGRDMMELVKRMEPSMCARMVLITNWAERRPGPEVLPCSILKRDKLVVLFAGNMGRTHDGKLIELAAKQLRDENIVFTIAVASTMVDALKERINREHLSNLHIIPLRPHRIEQWDTLDAGDVVLIVMREGMAGVSVPSRMYNAMAARKPIIAVTDAHSELAQVIVEERIGWVVPPRDIDGLCQAVLAAERSPMLVNEMGARAERCAKSRFQQQLIMARYDEVLEAVAGRGRARE